MTSYLNIAAYKFIPLDQLPERRTELRQQCHAAGLKGTILLSPEGINLFVAGLVDSVHQWMDTLRQIPQLADLEIKESFSDHQPFNRMLVKLKKEIIAFGIDGISPHQQTSTKMDAKTLKSWLDEGRDVTLLDVRNDYEVSLGTFRNAMPIGIDHFRNFPSAVRSLPEKTKEKPVVMFCTGGIRCEKAGPFMEREGFQNVFQLDGGILKYFEVCGNEHYDGDCFVFDKRVAVTPKLAESEVAQCYACQAIVHPEEQQSDRYVVGESCPHCYQRFEDRMREQISQRQETIQKKTVPLPGSVSYDNVRPINVPQKCDRSTLLDAMCQMHPHIGQTEWQDLFAKGRIRQRNVPVRPARTVRAGEQFQHHFPNTVEPDVNAKIKILWEDKAFVAVDKPAPLPMHPCGRFNRNTLTYILGQTYRPEILRPAHRLDANTTGVVLLSRSRAIAQKVQDQFDQNLVKKEYLAVCLGHPSEETFRCVEPINQEVDHAGSRTIAPDGLQAETLFQVIQRNPDGTSLLKAQPITGRTNQIRIHLWDKGFPIVGDPIYLLDRQRGTTQTLDLSHPPMQLHAWKLTLTHPISNQQILFVASPPDGFPSIESFSDH